MSNVFDNVGVEWPPPSNAEVEKFRRIKIAIASGDLTGEQARTLLLNRTMSLRDVEDTITRAKSFKLGSRYAYTDILSIDGTDVFGRRISPNAITDNRVRPSSTRDYTSNGPLFVPSLLRTFDIVDGRATPSSLRDFEVNDTRGRPRNYPHVIDDKAEIPYKFSFQCHRKFYAPVDYGQGADRMTVLPVTPEAYSYSVSNQASTFTTVGGGTYSHTIGIDLEKISFEAILPTEPSNKTYVVPYLAKFGYVGAKRMAKNFYYSAQANQPILFSVVPVTSDGTANGEPLIDPIPMTITSLSAEIRPGHGSDLFISLELQRWHDQEAGIGFTTSQFHVVKKGDSLQRISATYLGSEHRWPEIIALNPKIFRAKSGIKGQKPPTGHSRRPSLSLSNKKLKAGQKLTLPRS